MNWFIFNGKMEKEGSSVIGPDNRGLRYGDGLFETMKMINGEIILSVFHFERLFSGLSQLHFNVGKHFTAALLQESIKELCKKNNCSNLARIRLAVFRGEGGLYDERANQLNYIIQAWPLSESVLELNENGLSAGIYREVRKSCDPFSNIKSANYLPYVMAAIHAKNSRLNEAILLNTNDRICDATIANVFIVKDNEIITPALTEGCVAGVMRRYLLLQLPAGGYKVLEAEITEYDLINADEVYLTNAIYGLKWVKEIGSKKFSNEISATIFKDLVRKLNDHK